MLIIYYFFQDMQRHLLLELILFLCLLLSAKFSQMYAGLDFIDVNDVSFPGKLCWSLDQQRTEKGFVGLVVAQVSKLLLGSSRGILLAVDEAFEDGHLLFSCFTSVPQIGKFSQGRLLEGCVIRCKGSFIAASWKSSCMLSVSQDIRYKYKRDINVFG